MKKSVGYLVLLSGLFLSLTGCAFTPEYVKLNVTPSSNAQKISGADQVNITVEVTDSRPDKAKVAAKGDGYGQEAAPFLVKEDVAVMVKDAISAELKNRGFKLENGKATLGIEITHLYAKTEIGFWSGSMHGAASLAIQVKTADGNIKFIKTISGEATKKGLQMISATAVENALDGALADTIAKLMADESFIKALLDTAK
jgi:uncharacterized lipoprotein YajG